MRLKVWVHFSANQNWDLGVWIRMLKRLWFKWRPLIGFPPELTIHRRCANIQRCEILGGIASRLFFFPADWQDRWVRWAVLRRSNMCSNSVIFWFKDPMSGFIPIIGYKTTPICSWNHQFSFWTQGVKTWSTGGTLENSFWKLEEKSIICWYELTGRCAEWYPVLKLIRIS